jgi:hypothetical protein
MAPLLQLTRHGIVHASARELCDAKMRFLSEHRLHLPQFLAPEVLALLTSRLARAPFRERVAHNVHPPAVDLKLAEPALHGAMRWMMSDPLLLSTIGNVSGVVGLDSFNGAVYRMTSQEKHRDSWHDDVDGRRAVGITVNVSDGRFVGGELQMRRTATRELLWRFANIGEGDALLFAIDRALEHCVAPVTGGVPKTALAGWFCIAAAPVP